MYRAGHLGAGMLVYAPVGSGLLLAGYELPAVFGLLWLLALTTLPDVDHRLPFVSHRGSTHTLAFALGVGLATGTLALAVASGRATETALAVGGFGFLVGFLAIVAHLLADVITPSGITPFWPLSSAHYTLDVVRADNAIANYLLLALGAAAVATMGYLASG